MTPERGRQLLQVQAGFGGFYNAGSSRLAPSGVMCERGQRALYGLIAELEPDRVFSFRPSALRGRLGPGSGGQGTNLKRQYGQPHRNGR
jgi:hypothetical protein